MKKLLFCLLTLISSLPLQAQSTILLRCKGSIKTYTDYKAPLVNLESIVLEIEPKYGLVKIEGWWGCSGPKEMCEKFKMSENKGEYFFEKNIQDGGYDMSVSINLNRVTGKLETQHRIRAEPRIGQDWKTKVFNGTWQCEVSQKLF